MTYKIYSRGRQKMEFSKKILLVAAFFNIVIILFTLVMIWRTQDLSPLTQLIITIGAETATGTGFYYAKAAKENQIKLKRIYGVDAEGD